LVSINPLKPREEEGTAPQTRANSLGRLLQAEILNNRALGGRKAIELASSELVDLGTASMKVIAELDSVRKIGPTATSPDAKPRIARIPGRVRWEAIPFERLVFADGFGTDTQSMPFVGHEFDQTWTEIMNFAKLGHYDEDTVMDMKTAAKDGQGHKPMEIQDHPLLELYLDWDVDDDGVQESILITWHRKAKKRLRTRWNPYPDGRRPILMSQFDIPANSTDAAGQGVSEKLEGPQDEIDSVHNIGLEAGKRGAAHVVVIKEGTRAEEEFGGEDDILPGDVIVTGTPDEDIVTRPLGDASVAMALVSLEEHTRQYVTRILGLDESSAGDLQAGKRVAASVGMSTIREGRMIIKSALSSVAEMLSEASYLTLDLYKQNAPTTALQAVLTQEEIEDLQESVFSLSDTSTRDSFLIRVNAQDAATVQDTKQQEALMISQSLIPFWDRIERYIITASSPETPPNTKQAILLLMESAGRGMEAILNTVEFIQRPDELLVKMGELRRLFDDGTAPLDVNAEPDDDATLVGDLSAGVA
jgi:hypothetical protein